MITIEADWLSAFFRLAVIGLELAGTLTILVGAGLATFLFARRASIRSLIAARSTAGGRWQCWVAASKSFILLRTVGCSIGFLKAERSSPSIRRKRRPSPGNSFDAIGS